MLVQNVKIKRVRPPLTTGSAEADQGGDYVSGLLTIGANTPVSDLGFVYLISMIVLCGQTRCLTNCAININQVSTLSTRQVVMVVDTVFVTRGGTRGLYPAYQSML